MGCPGKASWGRGHLPGVEAEEPLSGDRLPGHLSALRGLLFLTLAGPTVLPRVTTLSLWPLARLPRELLLSAGLAL